MRLLGQPRKKVTRQLAGRELLRIDGDFVPVTLRLNPRARRLIVKVHPSTGEVTVVAPSRRALEGALAFARSVSSHRRRRKRPRAGVGRRGRRRAGHPRRRSSRTRVAPCPGLPEARSAQDAGCTHRLLCRQARHQAAAHYRARHRQPLGFLFRAAHAVFFLAAHPSAGFPIMAPCCTATRRAS